MEKVLRKMSNNKNRVQSVIKVILILEELAKHDGSMKLTNLARALEMPTSTVYRLLSSLMDLGYVNQNAETGEYTLGLKLLSLSSVVLRQMNLRKIAYPYLEKLQQMTDETANLVVLDSDEVMYVEKVESRQPVRTFSMIGRRAPVHATGAGKVLLADMRSDEVLAILRRKGMKSYTKHTITDYKDFTAELNQVRVQGFAFDKEECELGVVCIAAPVRNHEGRTVASVSISGPSSRLTPAAAQEMVGTVVGVGRELSAKLGFVEGISNS